MATPKFVIVRSISQVQQKGKPIKGLMNPFQVRKMPHAIAALQIPFRVSGQKG
jgi:hypothetical protein